jgi:hypothetical protein
VRWSRATIIAAGLAVMTAACSTHTRSSTPASTSPASTIRPHRAGNRSTTTVPSSRPDGHGSTDTVPSSIATDCSTDVTDALQAWLDHLPDHVTAALRAGGCYRIEGTVVLADRHDLTLAGNGATLKATTVGTGGRLARRQRSQLSIIRSVDITVRDLIVRGANPRAGVGLGAYQANLEAQHAFSLHGDDGVTLDRVQAYDVYGDFVYIGGTGTPSRHVTVVRSRFARSGRQGISITDGDDVLITGNEITDVARSVFDLEPNTRADEVRHIRIENNRTGRATNYWLADKGSGINVGDVTVSRNVMQAPSGALVIVSGPSFGKRGPFTFSGNVFETTGAVTDENAAGAFLFANAAGVRVSGNAVRVAPRARLAGVELRNTSSVVVRGNRFTGVTTTVTRI